jgi:hypothetical protein
LRKPIYYYLIKQLFVVLFISLTKTKIKYCKEKIFYRLNAIKIDKMPKILFYYKFLITKIIRTIINLKIFYLNQCVIQR